MPTEDAAQRPAARDREATSQWIVDCAAQVLAKGGYGSLGVNALAAAAGVDKQLIYRYFGGIDGVVRALGSRLEFWLGGPLPVTPGEPYAKAVARLLVAYLERLHDNPLLQGLLAWELAEPSPVLNELDQTRSAQMYRWAASIRLASTDIPQGVDAPAINALLLAGIHYLVLRQRTVGSFAGIDLQQPENWRRIEAALERIASSAYGQHGSDAA